MAYQLIWSAAARDDLHDIVTFIAHDNPNRAMSFGYELISETDRLQDFPELGRIVLNIEMMLFARSFFGRIESYTALISGESYVKLHASGIPREELFNSDKSLLH